MIDAWREAAQTYDKKLTEKEHEILHPKEVSKRNDSRLQNATTENIKLLLYCCAGF